MSSPRTPSPDADAATHIGQAERRYDCPFGYLHGVRIANATILDLQEIAEQRANTLRALLNGISAIESLKEATERIELLGHKPPLDPCVSANELADAARWALAELVSVVDVVFESHE